MSTWSDVDEPVLRWVGSLDSTFLPQPIGFRLGLRDGIEDPSEEVPSLSSELVDESLRRLLDHGLISGRRKEAIGFADWARLRITGQGRQVLGDWPDLDRVASVEGMQLLLDALADEAKDPPTRTA